MEDIRIITKESNNVKLYAIAIQSTIDSYRPKLKRFEYKISARLGSKMPARELGECRYSDLADGILSIKIKCTWKCNFIDNLAVLIHESIHAAQYITHVNKISDDGEFFWCGKSHGYINYDKMSNEYQYKKLPWEKEAYDLENNMMENFMKYYISEVRTR